MRASALNYQKQSQSVSQPGSRPASQPASQPASPVPSRLYGLSAAAALWRTIRWIFFDFFLIHPGERRAQLMLTAALTTVLLFIFIASPCWTCIQMWSKPFSASRGLWQQFCNFASFRARLKPLPGFCQIFFFFSGSFSGGNTHADALRSCLTSIIDKPTTRLLFIYVKVKIC